MPRGHAGERSISWALRLFLRLAPSERQRVFVLTLVIGALCGLAAVTLHLAIQAAEGALIERAMAAPGKSWMLWTILRADARAVCSAACCCICGTRCAW